jgi:hypothetical protein
LGPTVTTLSELVQSGSYLRLRLEQGCAAMQEPGSGGSSAGGEPSSLSRPVRAAELPEWYLRCYRALLALYGKESREMRQWNEFLRSAREARPTLDESNELEVMRAGMEDLAGALRVLQGFDRGGGITVTIRPAARHPGDR